MIYKLIDGNAPVQFFCKSERMIKRPTIYKWIDRNVQT